MQALARSLPRMAMKDALLGAIIALDDVIQQAGKKDEIRPLVIARLFAEEWLRKLDQPITGAPTCADR